MTPSRRAELRRLSDAATPGPWSDTNSNRGKILVSDSSPHPVIELYGPDSEHHINVLYTDLTLIAAARNALPELLDELEESDQRIVNLEMKVRALAAFCER